MFLLGREEGVSQLRREINAMRSSRTERMIHTYDDTGIKVGVRCCGHHERVDELKTKKRGHAVPTASR